MKGAIYLALFLIHIDGCAIITAYLDLVYLNPVCSGTTFVSSTYVE